MSDDTDNRTAAPRMADIEAQPAEAEAEAPAAAAEQGDVQRGEGFDEPEAIAPAAAPCVEQEAGQPAATEAPADAGERHAAGDPEQGVEGAVAPAVPETGSAQPAAEVGSQAFEGGQPTAVVGFQVPGQAACYCAAGLALKRNDRVVVEGERGGTVGTVLRGRCAAPDGDTALKNVVRKLSPEDERVAERNRVREREAFQFCQERIKTMRLPMKLVSVSLAHSGTRANFNFTSAERVDFRALVKELARRFHTRIEMRQIGVRDAARYTGGLGICGRELCCATWLSTFKPISIRMAKDQNLSLNHEKLSGLCGRLRCCLEYEQDTYHEKRQGLPKVGKRVVTPQGEGRVKDLDVLRRTVRVELLEGGYATFEADEVARVTAPVRQPSPAEEPAEQGAGAQAGEAGTSGRRRRRRGRRRRRAGTDEEQAAADPQTDETGSVGASQDEDESQA